MVGLSQVRRRTVGEFSKGMQRRIGLAQALINDPDLVILDEPTSGLDPIGCREVKDLILALSRRGKTVILSSHLLADVEDVCDRVVIYYGGHVQAMGTLTELLAQPNTLRITTPLLPREKLQAALRMIRQEAGEEEVRVDTPTQNLESYFLDVVERAKRSETATSGATSGHRVAAYLRGEADESTSGDRVLDRLVQSESGPPLPAPKAVKVQEEKVDERRLDALAEAAPAPASSKSQPEQPKKAEPDRADEKLSGLLGGKQ